MFSSELESFILNNIYTKDFMSKDVLENIRMLIIKKVPDIKYVLRDTIIGKEFQCVGIYTKGKVYINIIEMNEFYSNTLEINRIQSNLLVKNLLVLSIYLHETVHAFQTMINLTETKGLMNDLIIDSNKVLDSNLFSEKKYDYYHDIIPIERIADAFTFGFLLNIYDKLECTKAYPNFKSSVVKLMMKDYDIIPRKVVSPIEKFYKIFFITKSIKRYNFDYFSDKDKFLLGVLDSEEKINKVVSDIINNDSYSKKRGV